MPEIRQDPTTNEWVIIASERAGRAHDFAGVRHRRMPPDFSHDCPFCPGNEVMTPTTLLSFPQASADGWRLRVVTNKFPALDPCQKPTRRREQDLFLSAGGGGFHEVIIETPIHNKNTALMSESEVSDVLQAYLQRYKTISRQPGVRFVSIFKNHGPSAGTSLEHPHSQLIGTPVVPRHVRDQTRIALEFFDKTGTSLYEEILEQELAAGTRVVLETERFLSFHPFASHRPYETWIVPKQQQPCFTSASVQDIQDLARVLRLILRKLHMHLDDPDFNYVVCSCPVGDENHPSYSWHVRVYPRLTETAGFELGSGIHINVASPEKTAPALRETETE